MSEKMLERTALYRLYDPDDNLLYIGITSNPAARWSAHAREQEWWFLVARKEVLWYEDRDEAHAAEVAAITSEDPAWNLWHSPQLQREGSSWVRDMPTIPASVRASREAEQRATSEGRIRAAAKLETAARRYEYAERLRNDLHEAIVGALRAGMGPSEISRMAPYDRNHIRRIAKAAGVPARRRSTAEPLA